MLNTIQIIRYKLQDVKEQHTKRLNILTNIYDGTTTKQFANNKLSTLDLLVASLQILRPLGAKMSGSPLAGSHGRYTDREISKKLGQHQCVLPLRETRPKQLFRPARRGVQFLFATNYG